jgi:hypothetical protein
MPERVLGVRAPAAGPELAQQVEPGLVDDGPGGVNRRCGGLAPAQVVERPAPDLQPCSRRDHPITTDPAQPPRHDPRRHPDLPGKRGHRIRVAGRFPDAARVRRTSLGRGHEHDGDALTSAHIPVRAGTNASGSGGIVRCCGWGGWGCGLGALGSPGRLATVGRRERGWSVRGVARSMWGYLWSGSILPSLMAKFQKAKAQSVTRQSGGLAPF